MTVMYPVILRSRHMRGEIGKELLHGLGCYGTRHDEIDARGHHLCDVACILETPVHYEGASGHPCLHVGYEPLQRGHVRYGSGEQVESYGVSEFVGHESDVHLSQALAVPVLPPFRHAYQIGICRLGRDIVKEVVPMGPPCAEGEEVLHAACRLPYRPGDLAHALGGEIHPSDTYGFPDVCGFQGEVGVHVRCRQQCLGHGQAQQRPFRACERHRQVIRQAEVVAYLLCDHHVAVVLDTERSVFQGEFHRVRGYFLGDQIPGLGIHDTQIFFDGDGILLAWHPFGRASVGVLLTVAFFIPDGHCITYIELQIYKSFIYILFKWV